MKSNNKKNLASHRDGKLATQPPKSVYKPKMAEEIKNGIREIGQKHNGRKSYVERAIEAGVYKQIAVTIKQYRESNPDCSYTDLYLELNRKFPMVFSTPLNKMYISNISKIINSDTLWRTAYWTIKDRLIALAEIRIHEALENKETDISTVLKSYDLLKKYDLEEKKMAMADKSLSEDGDIPTFVFKNNNDGE